DVAAAAMGHAANHCKPDAIKLDERAHRWAPGEQRLQQFVTKHDHIASLRPVQFIEPASLLEGKVTDLVELRFCSQDFAARVGEFAHRMQVTTGNQGGSVADAWGLRADIEVVLIGE